MQKASVLKSASLIAAGLLTVVVAAMPTSAATAFIYDVTLTSGACGRGLSVRVNTDDFQHPPVIYYTTAGTSVSMPFVDSPNNPPDSAIYYTAAQLPLDTEITIEVVGEENTVRRSFRVLSAGCENPGLISSVRGAAFEDKNGDGRRDAGEPNFGGGWFKLAGPGAWFVCGYTGDDDTYGVAVQPGVYYILPSAPQGWRATTPRLVTVVTSTASLQNDIGFMRDPASPGDACDQYNPPRPMLPAIPAGRADLVDLLRERGVNFQPPQNRAGSQ